MVCICIARRRRVPRERKLPRVRAVEGVQPAGVDIVGATKGVKDSNHSCTHINTVFIISLQHVVADKCFLLGDSEYSAPLPLARCVHIVILSSNLALDFILNEQHSIFAHRIRFAIKIMSHRSIECLYYSSK